jgi:hypothetical protein
VIQGNGVLDLAWQLTRADTSRTASERDRPKSGSELNRFHIHSTPIVFQTLQFILMNNKGLPRVTDLVVSHMTVVAKRQKAKRWAFPESRAGDDLNRRGNFNSTK